jgi:phosphoglycolate phosphatase-like HAD superfamily hydrolase
MKKNIIFDFDGTLVEFPTKFMFDETHRIINLLGLPKITDEELEDCFSDFDFFRFARGLMNDLQAEEQFKNSYWKEFKWHQFPLGIPFPETAETLGRLSKMGYELSIATARVITPEELFEELNRCGIGSFFKIKHIQTRLSHADEWKDKTPQIKNLIDTMNIPAEDSMIVGDIPSDVMSGKETELGFTIAVQSGGIKKEVLEACEPDAVLLHLGDLPNFLIDLDF